MREEFSKKKDKHELDNIQDASSLKKRSFFDEFKVPLHMVERKWLRRSVTTLLSPLVFFVTMIFSPIYIIFGWFKENW